MTSFYGSEDTPKRVFGEGELLRIFYRTMEELAPGAWALNQLWLDIWNPKATEYNWIMPDNFHVQTKVESVSTKRVFFLDTPFEVPVRELAPTPRGRSLCANSTHSIDGLGVREITLRCGYNPNEVAKAKILLAQKGGTNLSTEGDKLVKTLWENYEKSGFLSLRILQYLTPDNVGHIKDAEPVLSLIGSLPKKPFPVLSVHD